MGLSRSHDPGCRFDRLTPVDSDSFFFLFYFFQFCLSTFGWLEIEFQFFLFAFYEVITVLLHKSQIWLVSLGRFNTSFEIYNIQYIIIVSIF